MEHGNGFQAAAPVRLRVLASVAALAVWITDQGGRQARPAPVAPDLEAKLAGLQTPRGWGLFLIERLVDEMHERDTGAEHTVELILYGHDVPAAGTPTESVPTTETHDRDRRGCALTSRRALSPRTEPSIDPAGSTLRAGAVDGEARPGSKSGTMS